MHTDRLYVRLVMLCVFLVTWGVASAQLLDVKHDVVYSNVLKQNRPLDVYVPEEVEKNPAQRYETIYVLDGDWNAQIVVNVVTFMRHVGFIPPVIVVGLPNVVDEHGFNSRDHDFTPTMVADKPRSGGAADFLAFLKTELVPYIDERYPASQVHLIHGHSLGGLFVMYTLMHEPALFDGYMILDPAMWWDKHAFDEVIEQKLADVPAKAKAIYIGGRSGRGFEYMGLSTIEPIFKRKASPDLHWQITAYPEESHDSLKLKGSYDALKFAYQGYTTEPIFFFPTTGIVSKGKPVYLLLNGAADELDRLNLHYSTDGSAPTATSPKVVGELPISKPEQTEIKLLSNRGIFDRDIPHGLKSGAVLPPDRRMIKKTDIWHVTLYPANAWMHFGRNKAFKTFDTDESLHFAEVGRDSFAGTVERSLEIPTDGYYVFGLASGGKLRLSVAGRVLIDNDGTSGQSRPTYVVPLQRGVYHVRLEFQRAAKDTDVDMVVFQCKDGEPEWPKNRLFTVSSRK